MLASSDPPPAQEAAHAALPMWITTPAVPKPPRSFSVLRQDSSLLRSARGSHSRRMPASIRETPGSALARAARAEVLMTRPLIVAPLLILLCHPATHAQDAAEAWQPIGEHLAKQRTSQHEPWAKETRTLAAEFLATWEPRVKEGEAQLYVGKTYLVLCVSDPDNTLQHITRSREHLRQFLAGHPNSEEAKILLIKAERMEAFSKLRSREKKPRQAKFVPMGAEFSPRKVSLSWAPCPAEMTRPTPMA